MLITFALWKSIALYEVISSEKKIARKHESLTVVHGFLGANESVYVN